VKEQKWFLHPAWELYDTWLVFYDTLPVDIPSFNLNNNKCLKRPRAFHYLENLDIIPVEDING
jgi:hypothetical protein